MGFPLELAVRYMASKKRSSISMGTFLAVLGVAFGVAGLATAVSVTGGFRKEFRDKVLGVNAHVLVLKRSSYFGEYRDVMDQLEEVPGVTGIAPFTINPMMLTKEERTATGVLLKGVDPHRVDEVLDLPQHLIAGSLEGLRVPGARPAESRNGFEVKADDLPGSPPGDFLDELGKIIEEESKDLPAMGGAAARPDAEVSGTTALPEELPDQPSEEEIAELTARFEAQTDTSQEAVADDQLAELAADAPVGRIVPEGGYQSLLPEDDILPEDLNPDPCAGDSAGLPGVVIGKTLGENLKASIGDCIQITSPTIGFTFAGDSIRAPVAKQFRVVGIFYAGFDQYDAKLAYVDLYQAQQFHDSGDSVTGVEMKIADIDDAKSVAADIDELLGDGLLYTMDWEELNHGLFTALRIQQILMSVVLGLIIIVAAFTVIATLIMVVFDKKKEIAVMKAMGATNNHILRAFLYQGGIIGVLGAFLGLILGLLMCHGLIRYGIPLDPTVYFISHLPVDVQTLDFALIGVFAVVVCLGATVWPALHAASLRPAEAFRDQQ